MAQPCIWDQAVGFFIGAVFAGVRQPSCVDRTHFFVGGTRSSEQAASDIDRASDLYLQDGIQTG
jgi:hypothetical protein